MPIPLPNGCAPHCISVLALSAYLVCSHFSALDHGPILYPRVASRFELFRNDAFQPKLADCGKHFGTIALSAALRYIKARFANFDMHVG